MKKILSHSLILPILLLCAFLLFSQVEVRSTSPNSVLDINSSNKAILLPRIDNTSLVNSPEEGLFVYNKASMTPSYHDGTQWNNVGAMMMPTSDEDSLTYTIITGYGSPLGPGTFDLISINAAGSSYDITDPAFFDISKENDARTRGFMTLLFDQSTNNSVTIEINVYKNGASTPYFSYKTSNLEVVSYGFGSSKGSNRTIENYTIKAKVYGFKDYGSGNSIAWSSITDSTISYASF